MITQKEFESFEAAYVSAAYYDAMYGACAGNDDGGGTHMIHTEDDFLHPSSRQRMHEDCIKFLNGDGMEAAIESALLVSNKFRENYDKPMYAQAGYLFWHTRNGSGAGFWDGDYSDLFSTALCLLSKSFGECELYEGDDEYVYILGAPVV